MRNPKRLAAAVSRRQFVTDLARAGAGALTMPPVLAALNADAGQNAAGIPMRVLGRTKEKITILGLGTAPVGHSMPGAAVGVPIYRAALEAGINYVDTARGYDDAEGYLGELVPQYRDRIFLTTKSLPRGSDPRAAAKSMQEQFERSLRLMKTDHVDLLHIHSVGDSSPELILAPGGPLDWVRKMREKGQTRFIGITGHSRPPRFTGLLETGEFDVLMVVLNFADYSTYRFEEEILPVARKHHCGILAMKVYGGHRNNFAGYRNPGPSKMPTEYLERAMRYSLSIEGVAGAIIGVYTADEVKRNVEWAKAYRPLSAEERESLRADGRKLAEEWGPRFGPVA
ncbi:MAG: aldo/keto reductase [Verrucomicrobia bacterium]|nr:aldo/keto reductase [Verrucomicrobiota bacterium]